MGGPAVRFALRFAALFVVFTLVFESVRGTHIERWLINDFVVTPAAFAINALTPTEPVFAHEQILESVRAKLRVVRGCEGIETMLLLAAAMLAFPATWRRRASGLAVGLVLAWSLGVARLVFLYCTLRFSPEVFAITHGLIAPLAPIILVGAYFMMWSAPRASPAAIAQST